MKNIALSLVLAFSLAACEQSDQKAAVPVPAKEITQAEKDQAMQQFMKRETKKVRTLDELRDKK